MALTNAERQKRFRQKLHSRAAGSEIGEQVITAVDQGFAALWAVYSRPAADGSLWAEVDELPDLAAYKEYCRGKPEIALAGFDILLSPDDETVISDVERAAIERAAAVYRAALLKHVAVPAQPRNKGQDSTSAGP